MPVLERANAVIVAGAGASTNTNNTTTGTTVPIVINSGDTVIALGLIPTTTSAFSVSSPSNPVWQQRFFSSLNPFFTYVWTLENPVPANEPITFTRPALGNGLIAVQVYGRVGRIATVVQGAALGTTNPSYAPSVTTTVAGSMVVGAFCFNRGTSTTFTPTGQRVAFIGLGYTALLADLMVNTPSSLQLAISSTFTTQTGFNYFSAAVVLEPATVTPPPPTGSISAIRDQIVQWRQQAQLNKIYLMPPAQRAAALAQLKALADELKQAQIAQQGG